MRTKQIALGAGAVIGSFAAVGCWLLLQLGGVTRSEGPTTLLVMCLGTLVFVACVCGTAFLSSERAKGLKAVWRRAYFLAGAFGLPVPIFYIAVSRGAVLQLPEADCLLLILIALVAAFRPRRASPTA